MTNHPTSIRLLRAQAKLLAPQWWRANQSMHRMDAILDELGALMPLHEFEAFVAGLTPEVRP